MVLTNLPYTHLAVKRSIDGSFDEYYLYVVLYTGGTVLFKNPASSIFNKVTTIDIEITNANLGTPTYQTRRYLLTPDNNTADERNDTTIKVTAKLITEGTSTSTILHYEDAHEYLAPPSGIAYNAPYVALLPKTPTLISPENRSPKVTIPMQSAVGAITEVLPLNTTDAIQNHAVSISSVGGTIPDIWVHPPNINAYSYLASGGTGGTDPYFLSTVNNSAKSKIRSKHYVQQPLGGIIKILTVVIEKVILPPLLFIGALFTILIIKPLRWLIRPFTNRK